MTDKKQDDRRPKGDTGTTDIYTAKMGNPPIDPDMGSVPANLPKALKTNKKAKGGSISSASARGDGCAIRGKTKGRMV